VKGFYRGVVIWKKLMGGGEIGQRISSEKNRINWKKRMEKKEGVTKRKESKIHLPPFLRGQNMGEAEETQPLTMCNYKIF